MIISKTPFRMSFFGGGTDYPGWYLQHGGSVISSTFDKFTYVTCRELPPFFDHKYRIAYSKIENVKEIDQINHPVVKALLNEYKYPFGLEIHVDADLPARSGLGSSSAFVVGLINCLEALRGRRLSKQNLSSCAINVEQKLLNENVGSQDQVAAAYGGFNKIRFLTTGEIIVEPICIDKDRKNQLSSHLMLFFTGISRFSSEIASEQVSNNDANAQNLKKIESMVDQSIEILCSKNDIKDFGSLLDSAWKAKKELSSKITTHEIDEYYKIAKQNGAIGGKVLGAGGGGFLLMFVEPDKQSSVRNALSKLVHVPFEFENSGSQIIHYE